MESVAAKFRVALVGAGYVSTYHIRALQALTNVEIVGIADLDVERARTVSQQFGLPAAFSSLDEMTYCKPDVVHILTPPSSHCPVALHAFEMGCHVFVEKPMAESVEECDRMIAAATKVGRVLSVNHSSIMDPVVQRAVGMVQQGAIGRVLSVDFLRSSEYAPYAGGPQIPPQYRTGSYPLQDLGVHGLTLMEAFLGKAKDANIWFQGTGFNSVLTFDEWHGLVQCEHGTGHMYISWNVRPMQNELIVHGTHGVMHVDCFLQTCTIRKVRPGPKFVQRVISSVTVSLSNLVNVPINVVRFATGRLRPSPGIHASILAFYRALSEQRAVPIDGEDGRRIVACIEPASREADEQKALARQKNFGQALPPVRILVTGASGFLGSALVKRLLSRGESIRVLIRRPSEDLESNPRVQVVCGDLGDPAVVDAAIRDVQVVYHLGAAMSGGPADFERGTVWGTKNVIASALLYGVKRVMYVSSLSVLNHAHGYGKNIDETFPLEPHPEKRGFYTQTKLAAEQLVLEAVKRDGLPAVILRPGQIFGPGAEAVTPSGVVSLAGRWLVVGNGNLPLPLVYVEDAAEALLRAAEVNIEAGSIAHIVDPGSITQRQYIQACESRRPGKLKVHYVPFAVLFALGFGCDLVAKVLKRGLPLSRYRVRSIRPLSRLDTSVAREQLHWTPSVGVRKGLAVTFSGEPAEQEAVHAAGRT